MPILYSAIGKGSTVLCFYQQSSDSSYDVLASNILPNLSSVANAKTSYTTNNKLLKLIINGGCNITKPDITELRIKICDTKQAKCDIVTKNDVKTKFLSSNLLDRVQYSVENELNRDFGPVLANLMEKYSNPSTYQTNSHLSSVQAQVDEVKGVMTRNIEAVLQRGQSRCIIGLQPWYHWIAAMVSLDCSYGIIGYPQKLLKYSKKDLLFEYFPRYLIHVLS
ncbi:hypothetical protein HELRODRAFT_193359 [Helobdella robusta]|uniref:Uncharacterized protein n=1 Tax=Helobdella robusta TaxID=6412 RepID=T1FUW9_HELRO|nr:hypothetical protein HELRODRAFT_193359 [Helobdella robusta]ESN97088.1 hypothetical protein HELRODRAFT_193359 [Helobdella robusta]